MFKITPAQITQSDTKKFKKKLPISTTSNVLLSAIEDDASLADHLENISGPKGQDRPSLRDLTDHLENISGPKGQDRSSLSDLLENLIEPAPTTNVLFEDGIIKKNLIRDDVEDVSVRIVKEIIKDRELNVEFTLKPIEKKKSFQKSNKILSIGKTCNFFDADLFLNNIKEFLKIDLLKANRASVSDTLRDKTGYFWSLHPEETSNIIFVSEQIQKPVFSFDFIRTINDKRKSDFGRLKHFIGMKAKEDIFKTSNNNFSKALLKSFVKGLPFKGSSKNNEVLERVFDILINEEVVYTDNVFELSLPFSKSESEKYKDIKGILTSDIVSEYNFFIEEYEERIKQKDVLENTLPNMYFLLNENDDTLKSNPIFKEIITLGGAIEVETSKVLSKNKSREPKKTKVYDLRNNPLGQYYDLFARQYGKSEQDSLKKINKKLSNIIVSSKDLKLLQDFNKQEENFPMSVNISFSTDKTVQFGQILKDTNMTDLLISQAAKKISNNEFKNFSVQKAVEFLVDTERRR